MQVTNRPDLRISTEGIAPDKAFAYWADAVSGPLFQTPEEAARQAVENDAHIIGFSSLAAGHKTLLPALVQELEKLGRPDIMCVIGGVIPAPDYQFLRDHGAAAIFGPGTVIPVAAMKILEELKARLHAE